MSSLPTPAEIEAKAAEAGLTPVELCKKAGIAPSTFYRWKSGATSPTLDICRRLIAACDHPTPASGRAA